MILGFTGGAGTTSSGLTYKGTWDALTNNPFLASGVGTDGDYYIVSVAGTTNLDGITSWGIGDWAIFNGGTWQKIDNSVTGGTVTSVGLSMPSAFSVANSPITGSGSLNVTALGTTSQVILGDGTLGTLPVTSGFVPYTGATNNVDLGTYNLTADHITLNVNPSGAGFVVGTTEWNNTDGTSQTLLKGGNVILKNGVDLVARVVNNTGVNVLRANYQIVKVSGAQGQRLAVDFAQADGDPNSADTLGVVVENINNNLEGFIMTVGELLDIDTTGNLQGETWADGDVLYLSTTTPGALTNVKPTALQGHLVIIGYVIYAHPNNGKIYVKIMNGWELDELHNVYINPATLSNNDVLAYNSTSQLWENETIAQVITLTTTGTSGASTLIGNTLNIPQYTTGLNYFTEAQNTSAPNGTVYVDSLTTISAVTNTDFSLIPKGTGALLGAIPDNTLVGGNKRGNYAVDWQLRRNGATRVASGTESIIIGGYNNGAYGTNSIAGGVSSEAVNTNSIALGSNCIASGVGSVAIGTSNTVSGTSATSIGASNTASGNYSIALGGSNTTSGQYAVGLGYNNTASGIYSVSICSQGNTFSVTDRFSQGGRGYVVGDTQKSVFTLSARTTGDTPTTMCANFQGTSVASTSNQVTLQNNNTFRFYNILL